MILLDNVRDINKGQVSLIDQSVLQDNIAKTAIGWLFLDNTQNQFSIDRLQQLFHWIFTKLQLKRRFIQSKDPIQQQSGAITQFKQDLVDIQELIVLLSQITGGLLQQVPKLFSIRYWNTVNRGLQNIRIEGRLVFFVLQTHKNYI